jgi:hypothetical protein
VGQGGGGVEGQGGGVRGGGVDGGGEADGCGSDLEVHLGNGRRREYI